MRSFLILCAVALIACSGDETEGTSGGSGGDGATVSTGGEERPTSGAEIVCPAGEVELADGSCLAPGIPSSACGEGFVADNDACTAVFVDGDCPDGTMAIPGETTCREVAACGSGPWGDIPTDGSTIYVQSGESLQAAIDAAPAGALIAVGAGTYGGVAIGKPIRLWGVCPALTSIDAFSNGVQIQADDVELHNLAITGQTSGVWISGGQGIVIDKVHIHDTGWTGLYQEGGIATVSDSLVERATGTGIGAFGGDLTVERSMVRDVLPGQNGNFGYGMTADFGGLLSQRGTLTVRRSAVVKSHALGISTWGADTLIEDTLVSSTQPRAADDSGGEGITGFMNVASGERGNVTIRRSVVRDNHWCGICFEDADAIVEHTVSRNTKPQASDGDFGYGMRSMNWELSSPVRPTLDVSASVVERARYIGFVAAGAVVDARQLIVRDIEPRELGDKMGRPMSIEPSQTTRLPSELSLQGARLENGFEGGLMVIGATADVDSVWIHNIGPNQEYQSFGVGAAYVRDIFNEIDTGGIVSNVIIEDAHTVGLAALGSSLMVDNLITRRIMPEVLTGDFGDGVIASEWIFIEELFPTDVALNRTTVESAPRAGIVAFAATVTVANSALECNAIQLDKERYLDKEPMLDNLGGNVCGCETEVEDCKVLSSDIQPPSPPL